MECSSSIPLYHGLLLLFQHDEATEQCSPGEFGDSSGNYIMFASATDGSKSNNQQVWIVVLISCDRLDSEIRLMFSSRHMYEFLVLVFTMQQALHG